MMLSMNFQYDCRSVFLSLGLFVHSYILSFPCVSLFCKEFLTFAGERFNLFGNPWLIDFVAVYGLGWYMGLHQ